MKKRKKNPVPPSSKLQEDLAFDLYKKFTGHNERKVVIVDAPDFPKAVLLIGAINAIEYDTVRDDVPEKYRHRFNKKSRPTLVSSYDGKQLYILGGEYDFTERGIVDRKK
jgi:hypothetical protein